MQAGERKNLKPLEVTRGLTTHGPHTIYPISVFVSGSFYSIRPGREPWLSQAGSGGEVMVDCDHLNGHAIVALEDGEYHCITPREDIPRFWQRKIIKLSPGQVMLTKPDTYYYIAKGKLDRISDRLINIPISLEPITLIAEQETIIAAMWIA